MVDLETRLGGEGGVNVRFVNNFLEERWSPAQRLNHYARARSRSDCSKIIFTFLDLCLFLNLYVSMITPVITSQLFKIIHICLFIISDSKSQLIPSNVRQLFKHLFSLKLCSNAILNVVCNAEGAVSVECLNHDGGREARCPGLSYAIIPPDQPCAPSPA